MRTEEKYAKLKRSVSGIMLMILCVLSFSLVSAEALPIDEYIQSSKTAWLNDVIYDKINEYGDGEDYNLYSVNCNTSGYGYFTVKVKILSELGPDEKVGVSVFKTEFTYEMYPLWEYHGKKIESIKYSFGSDGTSGFYIDISGPTNMEYQLYVDFHRAKNWEYENNNIIEWANPIDVNNTIHGGTGCPGRSYDYDYYEVDIPSEGIISFEMDRTPNNNHSIMIYDGKKSQIWKTKATSESKIVSKKIKVKTGKIYVKIFGTNSDRYDFKVVHKQTTNTPNKPKITGRYGLDKGFKMTWNNPGGVFSGYQFQYSKDKKFKNNVVSKWIGGKKTNKISIMGLERDTMYYCRIRTYNKVKNKTYYSAWSDVDFAFTKY